MDEYSFKALGTQWSVLVDGKNFPVTDRDELRAYIEEFEGKFSRFREGSEVNQFSDASAGTYRISKDFREQLEHCSTLRAHTNGAYDPAVGRLMELKGYDKSYSLREHEGIDKFELPEWDLVEEGLKINGPVVFDLGGTGKGYCIDMTARWLATHGYEHILVDGGGDVYATTKKDDASWRLAIQSPGTTDLVLGTVELRNQALAVSDIFKRRWGKNHHILHPGTKEPISGIVSVAVIAENAWNADSATSGLFLAPKESRRELETAYGAHSLICFDDGTCSKSANWPGEVFGEV